MTGQPRTCQGSGVEPWVVGACGGDSAWPQLPRAKSDPEGPSESRDARGAHTDSPHSEAAAAPPPRGRAPARGEAAGAPAAAYEVTAEAAAAAAAEPVATAEEEETNEAANSLTPLAVAAAPLPDGRAVAAPSHTVDMLRRGARAGPSGPARGRRSATVPGQCTYRMYIGCIG
jgi:hypothetical protein